jgi:dTDP-4-dehydrorhamnose reductase
VWKRILEARAASEMWSDSVQRGNPTYVGDVAAQTLALVRMRLRGLYNVVAEGAATRHAYVSRIVQAAGLACEVRPGPAFRRLAAVSPNESAVNYRLRLMGLDRMPSWTEALDRYVQQLLRAEAAGAPASPPEGPRA